LRVCNSVSQSLTGFQAEPTNHKREIGRCLYVSSFTNQCVIFHDSKAMIELLLLFSMFSTFYVKLFNWVKFFLTVESFPLTPLVLWVLKQDLLDITKLVLEYLPSHSQWEVRYINFFNGSFCPAVADLSVGNRCWLL
jgi:hypothetical protein